MNGESISISARVSNGTFIVVSIIYCVLSWLLAATYFNHYDTMLGMTWPIPIFSKSMIAFAPYILIAVGMLFALQVLSVNYKHKNRILLRIAVLFPTLPFIGIVIASVISNAKGTMHPIWSMSHLQRLYEVGFWQTLSLLLSAVVFRQCVTKASTVVVQNED